MRVHFCDCCGANLTGEKMHLLDLHHYTDECQKVPSIPMMEMCPPCKEWLKDCIAMKKYKEEVVNQQEET